MANSPEWEKARIKSKDAHSRFKLFAIDEGFRENMLPTGNGFVQRLKANRPTVQTKHTNTGNWLIGIQLTGVETEAGEQDSNVSLDSK
jgi:hypothetical protein